MKESKPLPFIADSKGKIYRLTQNQTYQVVYEPAIVTIEDDEHEYMWNRFGKDICDLLNGNQLIQHRAGIPKRFIREIE